jgi:hypothetical protein
MWLSGLSKSFAISYHVTAANVRNWRLKMRLRRCRTEDREEGEGSGFYQSGTTSTFWAIILQSARTDYSDSSQIGELVAII